MANTIGSDDLGQDQNSQPGQQNQPGQSNANQAGQAPQQQSQGGNAPAIGGGGSNQPNNPNAQRGSGYQNISKVIQANQGNQLGSTIGNNLQQVGSSAQNNLKAAQNQFNQQTSQNQFNTDANNQLVQNVLADPTQAVGNNQGSQFSNLISGQYQGPTGLNNAQQLQSQAAFAAQMGQALGSAGGRTGLLQQLVGNNGQYTAGQANLDNLLLGQSQDPSLQAAKRQALTLQGQTNNAITGAAAQGQQASNQAQQFGQGVRDQFGNVVTSANDSLQKQAIDAQQARDADYKNALSSLGQGQGTQQLADMLGLSQGENTFGVNAGQFLSENPLQANAANIASSQDYARMQALQKLGGQYSGQNANQVFQTYQDPSKAGQFKAGAAEIADQSGLQNAINNNQANFFQQLANINPGGQVDVGGISGNSSFLKPADALTGVTPYIGGPAAIANVLTGNGGAAASQARDSAKQGQSVQLQNYLTGLNSLAGQYGMNTGKYENQATGPAGTAAGQIFEPNNVGANYQNILNALTASLQANNGGFQIQPSSYPAIQQGLGPQQIPGGQS